MPPIDPQDPNGFALEHFVEGLRKLQPYQHKEFISMTVMVAAIALRTAAGDQFARGYLDLCRQDMDNPARLEIRPPVQH